MPTLEQPPLTDTLVPASADELAHAVREAHADGTPIYPIGGGTSLDFGLPARESGLGLSLRGLKRVIDYPARDMTITVEAGITIDVLAGTLARERQRLPLDLPNAHRATLGGVIATNTSGARRYGCGTVRDYVIGISAVDGRGIAFKGGGRVVKNVAGYDFCKLLTGSLGTLGVITQVTLKVKPIPECSRFVACRVRDWAAADQLLAALVSSRTQPVAVELLAGPAWKDDPALGSFTAGEAAHLVIGLEGTEPEVAWTSATLCDEWRRLGVLGQIVPDDHTSGLWMRLAQFPVEGAAPLVLKATVRPCKLTEFVARLQKIDANSSLQCHAASGVVVAKLAEFGAGGLSQMLVSQLQPAAAEHAGHVVVLSCATPGELTRQSTWGAVGDSAAVMEAVKRQFDPKNLLNRGRFVYSS